MAPVNLDLKDHLVHLESRVRPAGEDLMDDLDRLEGPERRETEDSLELQENR